MGVHQNDSRGENITNTDINLERDVTLQTCEKLKESNLKGSSPRKVFPPNKKQLLEIRRIDNAIDKLRQISDANKTQPETDFDIFCRSLAVQLNQMPLNRASICQHLQDVMTREHLYQ